MCYLNVRCLGKNVGRQAPPEIKVGARPMRPPGSATYDQQTGDHYQQRTKTRPLTIFSWGKQQLQFGGQALDLRVAFQTDHNWRTMVELIFLHPAEGMFQLSPFEYFGIFPTAWFHCLQNISSMIVPRLKVSHIQHCPRDLLWHHCKE